MIMQKMGTGNRYREIGWLLLAVLAINVLLFLPLDGHSQQVGPLQAGQVKQSAEPSIAGQLGPQDPIPQISPQVKGPVHPPSPQGLPPPGNDDCIDALNPPYVLSPNTFCVEGTLNQAGTESGETLACFSPAPSRTVWYSFIASSTEMWVSVTENFLSGSACNGGCTQNFGIALYRYNAVCPPTALGGCSGFVAYTPYTQLHNNLEVSGLAVGATYLIQVSQNPGCYNFCKGFCIKVGTYLNCGTCGSSCGPLCTFTGATPPSATTVATTCPGYPFAPPSNQFDTYTNCYTFTAPNVSIEFQNVTYSWCGGGTYTCDATLYNSSCGLVQTIPCFCCAAGANIITGLTIGATYTLCYNIENACASVNDSLIYPYVYTAVNALPVELIRFSAESHGHAISVEWATSSELNNKEFILERTANARDFTEIARINGAGNSTSLTEYRAMDTDPLTGLNFYRLRQIDFDGTQHTTRLVSAKFERTGNTITVAPNPARESAVVRYFTEGQSDTRILVSDLHGKQLIASDYTHAEEGLMESTIDLSTLTGGVYILQVVSNDRVITTRLIRE